MRLAAETSNAQLEQVMVTKKAARSVAALQHSLSVEKDRVCELEKQVDSTEKDKLVLIQQHKKGIDSLPLPSAIPLPLFLAFISRVETASRRCQSMP